MSAVDGIEGGNDEGVLRATHAVGILVWKWGWPYLEVKLPQNLGIREYSICEMLEGYTGKKMSLLFRNEEVPHLEGDDEQDQPI